MRAILPLALAFLAAAAAPASPDPTTKTVKRRLLLGLTNFR